MGRRKIKGGSGKGMLDGNPNRRGRPYSRLGILLTHLLERKQNKMAEQCCYQLRQQEHGPVPIRNVAEAAIPKHLEQRVISMYRRLVGKPNQSSRQRRPNE